MKKILLALVAAASLFFIFKFAFRETHNELAPLPPPAAASPKEPENPPLVDAIQASLRDTASKAKIEEILAKGGDPNAFDKEGRSVLSLAVRNNDVDGMALLLAKGADPNQRDRQMGWTPLMNASFQAARDPKFLPAVELLLSKGADPNIGKEGTLPLHVAVNNLDANAKEAKVIEVLIRGGAKPDGVPAASGAQAITPILLAAWNGKTAAAMALARGGASLEAQSPGQKTPAQTAKDSKHPELAGALEKFAKAKKPPAAVKKKSGAKKRR